MKVQSRNAGISLETIKTSLVSFKRILKTAQQMLALAWGTGPFLVVAYYITMLGGAFVPLAAAYATKLLIDDLQIAQQSLAATVPAAVVAALAARYIIDFVNNMVFSTLNENYLFTILNYRMQNILALRFHEKTFNLDLGHFESPDMQDMVSKTRESMYWRLPDYTHSAGDAVVSILGYATAFVVLAQFGWWLPLLLTLIALPRLYIEAKHGKWQWSLWNTTAPEGKKLQYLLNLMYDPLVVREARIAKSAESMVSKIRGLQSFIMDLRVKELNRYIGLGVIPPLVETTVMLWIAWLFLPDVVSGAMTIGTFSLLSAMLGQLGNRASALSSRLGRMNESSLHAESFFKYLDLPPLLHQPAKPAVFDRIAPPRIEFKNVSFTYPGGGKALDDVSFIIEPGESVALVGHNGAGKSTIIKLLCRFYDVTEGQILINGIDLKDIDLNNWYRFLGTLFQEFMRYNFTVRENITLGSGVNDNEELVRAAAQRAGAAEYIETFPGKYDQQLGKQFKDGVDLSGGQWQKLAIARAFYAAPPILILDEPTSSIDAAAEYEIFDNLEKQYHDKTLILVSHRFSTVRNANKIYVMDQGKIVESGTHDQLMTRQGEYARLFTLQAAGYK